MRAIFLSPHPDDAVLSCGGWIYQLARQGARPIVMTLFGGDHPAQAPLSDFAQQLQVRWQLSDDAPARRRQEDRAAGERLGCTVVHLPWADAVYRGDDRGRPLYATEEAIFDVIREETIVDRVAEAVQACVRLVPRAEVIAPLTAGRHVDHQITRLAAERLDRELLYYEDYPYAEKPERMTHVWGDTVGAARTVGAANEWVSETIGLSEDAVQAKIEAFILHRSQISTFYRDDAEVAQRIRAYANSVGQGQPAERYWRKIR